MWNPSLLHHPHHHQDGEPWEARAFPEDTGDDGTWPPRSYTCTFCRRHFRSAQALGGHMNIHRRDRARLRCQSADQELRLLHQLPNPSGTNNMAHACVNNYNLATPSGTLLSTIPYPVLTNVFSPFGAAPPELTHHHHHRRHQYYERLGELSSSSVDYARDYISNSKKESSSSAADELEELDLELRL